MRQQLKPKPDESLKRLHCFTCGNDDRFIQVMEYESHLVDANHNYLHLLDAEVSCYYCYSCGEKIDFDFMDHK